MGLPLLKLIASDGLPATRQGRVKPIGLSLTHRFAKVTARCLTSPSRFLRCSQRSSAIAVHNITSGKPRSASLPLSDKSCVKPLFVLFHETAHQVGELFRFFQIHQVAHSADHHPPRLILFAGAAALWHANAIERCATFLCAIESPAYRSCSMCCVSDLVGLPRVRQARLPSCRRTIGQQKDGDRRNRSAIREPSAEGA
jgi:hypothetical protein